MHPWAGFAYSWFTRKIEQWVSSPTALSLACLTVLAWIVSGPFFGWSDTWQLVINTGTTIVTFLMVFLIQNTQSRDTAALHAKMDELILVKREARNSLVGIERQDDQTLTEIRERIQREASDAI